MRWSKFKRELRIDNNSKIRTDWLEHIEKKIIPDNRPKIYTLICSASVIGWDKKLPVDLYVVKKKTDVERLINKQKKSLKAE